MISLNPFKANSGPSLRRQAEDLAARITQGSARQKGKAYQGDVTGKREGPGNSFWQFKIYQPGDRPQDIDWRISAKSDTVLVRQREREMTSTLDLFLQTNSSLDFASKPSLPTKLDVAAILNLTFCIYARQQGHKVKFNDRVVNTDLLEEYLNNRILHEFPAHSPQSNLILCGDFLDPLEALQKDIFNTVVSEQVVLMQILDPAEIDFPYSGRARFINTDQHIMIANAAEIAAQYRLKIQTHIKALQDYTQKRGWHYCLVRTDQDPRQALQNAIDYLWETA